MRAFLPKGVKIGRLFRWAFYLILGLLIAQILWTIARRSWGSGDYTGLALVLGTGFAVAAIGYLESRRPTDKFSPLHPWKIPDMTTRGVLWLMAGFNVLTTLAVFGVCMIPLWLLSGPSAALYIGMVSVMLFATLPYGYWIMRRLYDRVQVGEGAGDHRVLLRYRGYSEIRLRERLLAGAFTGVLIFVTLVVVINWRLG